MCNILSKSCRRCIKTFSNKTYFFSHLNFLIHDNALNYKFITDEVTFYNSVLSRFKHIVNPDIAMTELKRLASYFLDKEKNTFLEKSNKSNITEFWTELKELKNYADEPLFENIAKVALLILSLRHGNADVERVFSLMSDIKIKKRNKFLPETLSALLRIKLELMSKKVVV